MLWAQVSNRGSSLTLVSTSFHFSVLPPVSQFLREANSSLSVAVARYLLAVLVCMHSALIITQRRDSCCAPSTTLENVA